MYYLGANAHRTLSEPRQRSDGKIRTGYEQRSENQRLSLNSKHKFLFQLLKDMRITQTKLKRRFVSSLKKRKWTKRITMWDQIQFTLESLKYLNTDGKQLVLGVAWNFVLLTSMRQYLIVWLQSNAETNRNTKGKKTFM